MLEHGAYHNSNIDKIVNSIKADNYYSDAEKTFIKASMLRDHLKTKEFFIKELYSWKNDHVYLDWLMSYDKNTYDKLMRLFNEYKI